MILNPRTIGDRVRKLRKAENKSQEMLAEMADTSTRTICNIETGMVLPSLQTLTNIADSLECSLDDLIGREHQET